MAIPEEEEEVNLKMDNLYLVQVGDFDPSLNSLPILHIEKLGSLGKAKTDVPILEQRNE